MYHRIITIMCVLVVIGLDARRCPCQMQPEAAAVLSTPGLPPMPPSETDVGQCFIDGPSETVDFGTVAVGDTGRRTLYFTARSIRDCYCHDVIQVDRVPVWPFVSPPSRFADYVTLKEAACIDILFIPGGAGRFVDTLSVYQGLYHPPWAFKLLGTGIGRTGGISDETDVGFAVHTLSSPGMVRFTVAGGAGPVRVTIADRLGRTVAVLSAECVGTGAAVVLWPTAGVARGPYLYRVEAAGTVTTGKVVVGE